MRRGFGLAVALLMVFVVIAVPFQSEGVDADINDVQLYVIDGDVDIDAGDSIDIEIFVYNHNTESIYVRIKEYSGTSSDVSVSFPRETMEVQGNKSGKLTATIFAGRYASAHTDDITLTVEVVHEATSGTLTTSLVTVNVASVYSAGDSYNRIMGIWESPFDDPLYTTLVSALLWMVIAFIISFLIIPQILFLLIDEDKENRMSIRKQIWIPFSALIMLYALASCARVYGIGEEITAMIDSIVGIAYILVGAVISWRVYKAFVLFVFHRAAKKATVIDDSLLPLFNMIGKILIAVVAFASILAALGFDLLMILTGAGILGLAISLGAQNTLNQFFSGLTLLITRPFKPGDDVRIGNSDNALKVRRVGLMNTTFDDSNNSGTFSMPNNTVATSVIRNITGESRAYKIIVYVGVAYGTDIELTKKLLMDSAMENPRVIKDGSYDIPSARLDAFEDSYIKMRISMYVDEFEDYGSIGGRIRESIYEKFNEHGISIPFPQIDVRISK